MVRDPGTAAWLVGRVSALHRSVVGALRGLGRPESRVRTDSIQIGKSTMAAIGAWFVAGPVLGSGTAWLATITAVLMVHSTVYRSIAEGIKRVFAVAFGVVLAAAVGSLVGLNALGLLVVVPLSLLGARVRWIRAQGEYIAITAVVLLTFGMSTTEQVLLSYVRDTALGVVAGGLVNALLLPPGYQRSARSAVGELAARTAQLLRDLAGGVRTGWDAGTAEDWYRAASDLDQEARAAQSAVQWSREAQRWNPWPRRDGDVPAQRFQPALDTLWHVAIDLRSLARNLAEAPGVDGVAQPVQEDLAPLLESVAEVVQTYGADPAPRQDGLTVPVVRSLREAEDRYRDLAERLPPQANERAPFAVGGAMLQDLRRIIGYLRDVERQSVQ